MVFAPGLRKRSRSSRIRWAIGTRERFALALLLYTAQRRSDVVRMGRPNLRIASFEFAGGSL